MIPPMPYPVAITVVPQLANRKRMTTAFRLILALPHILLVGGIAGELWSASSHSILSIGGTTGLLGAVVSLLAIVSWFTVVLSGQHVEGIREITTWVVRWRARAIAYVMLLVDDYPPFGDGPYPVTLTIVDPPADGRNRLTVGLRLLLVIPHAIALFFVVCFWWIITIVAWFAILITGRYPAGLAQPAIGAMRWALRVEAYLLLLVDDYPPFSFE
jgi:hypothetical protein